ncbi:major facilitator superfamily antiporter [Musa troglodytarum]|uniref:Major facilitator superfamily antiporter n=1 Tax=Musa troglodytarum TaxID=320322 RepID=A0A9E7HSY1_9LILI|nr:major facilitator superfamily antiporter [Musa troglodytarum]
MEASTGPLLKVYYENCPGCKQDRKNEVRRGVPYREFFFIWIVTLCSALPVASLFPFLYFMVCATKLGSAFMIGRVLTSLFWGIVADRYGRKPVIVISIISIIIFNTMFGLSTSYWMALVSRLLLGCFSGLLGPIRAYASEVCHKEYQALGLSLVSSSRGIGLIVGPAIGGFFAQIFSLWAVSNKTYGGLSFSSQEVGEVLAISGLNLLVYQLFLYPCFEKYLGPISSSRAAAIFSIPLLTSYPFMSKLSGLKLFFVVNCASLLKNAISVTITTGFNILQNNAVPQHQRGAANGISVTALSLSKAVAPATAGVLFSWAQKRQQASFLSVTSPRLQHHRLVSETTSRRSSHLQSLVKGDSDPIQRGVREEMGNVNGRDGVEDGGDEDASVRSRSDADPGSTHVRRVRSVDSVESWPPESPGRSRSPLMFAPQVTIALLLLTVFGAVCFLFLHGCFDASSFRVNAIFLCEYIMRFRHLTSGNDARLGYERTTVIIWGGHCNLSYLKVPVPPLPGAVDAPPVFNQLWMNEPDQLSDGPIEKGIPTLITWNRGGNVVLVEGSWDNWTSRKHLQRSGKDHAILMVLPSGVYRYKFIVDGQLKYIPDLPFVSDEMGNITNLLDVHDYVPENVESISEFDLPPSPDSSYSWSLTDEDFAKEPPLVPSQLHLTVLGMQNTDEEASPKPQHVVLNHLFIEKGSSSQSMVALGLSHRFQSKYVTVVLYKPVRRGVLSLKQDSLTERAFPHHSALGKRTLVTVCASSYPDGKDGIGPEAAPSEGSQEAVSVENLPLESKLQMRLEQKLKMKLAKKIWLRRKRLLRKRRMRKKGRWPPSKMKKLKNV